MGRWPGFHKTDFLGEEDGIVHQPQWTRRSEPDWRTSRTRMFLRISLALFVDLYQTRGDLQALHRHPWLVSTVAEHEPRASRGRLAREVPHQVVGYNWTAITKVCLFALPFRRLISCFSSVMIIHPRLQPYLHGLNVYWLHFITKDPNIVVDFAECWGFIKTPWTTVSMIKEVQL